jgi:hypothetical protein
MAVVDVKSMKLGTQRFTVKQVIDNHSSPVELLN